MNVLYDYLMSMVGKPYIWGGNDPIMGFDCSGLALECLAAFGFKLPDQTAHNLYLWCQQQKFRPVVKTGSLAFYGNPSIGKVSHVAICLNKDLMIEAGGGGSRTKTVQDAINQDAYIRVRPIMRRGDILAIYYPEYPVKLTI